MRFLLGLVPDEGRPTPVFVLYLMGWDIDRLHNYDGSWLEWSYHEENPIATGQ